ncbi:MAG: hypothetical protein K2O81_01270, partial [Clostridia bacterium]|nr:hypothetical protein [Clostridia bacterium]
MTKKIKILFAVLLSALCLLIPFTGCKSPTSNYKVNFDYKLSSNNIEGSIECKIKVILPNAYHGNYKISYTLHVYADGLIIAKERLSNEFTINRYQG